MTSNEDLLREVLTGQATVSATLSGLADKVKEVGNDAREARDGLNRIEATLAEQDVAQKLAELRGEIKAVTLELRTDQINSYTRLRNAMELARKEIDDRQSTAEARIDALEAHRDKDSGARSFAGWLVKHAPWLAALLMTALATLGIERRGIG